LPTENFDGVLWKLESKFTSASIYKAEKSQYTPYTSPIKINESKTISAKLDILTTEKIAGLDVWQTVAKISQPFSFNKATGKKITLTTEADKKYPGDGAFTLVNGVQNEKGIAKSSEFLGFNGTDLDAIIDLGKSEEISSVKLHLLEQRGSWIYPPSKLEVYTGDDGINFKKIENAEALKAMQGEPLKLIEWAFEPLRTRYVKVFAKNFGIIPSGNAGAGNPAWLFVDEIEVQ
jgi:hexosaminidase